MHQTKNFLPILQRLVSIDDEEILINVLWAFSYLSDGDNDKITAILNLDVLKFINKALFNKNMLVISPALRTIGNLVTGTDQQTEVIQIYEL